MGKLLKSAAILLTASVITVRPAIPAEMFIEVDQQTPAETRCYVSCPNPAGFPDIPTLYPCDDLPEIGKDCMIIVKIITKPAIENAIRNLIGVTGGQN